jgi:hypothetical protein
MVLRQQNRLSLLNGIFLIFILLLGFALRTYKIDIPVTDQLPLPQAQTASTAKEYLKTGINIFNPKTNDLAVNDQQQKKYSLKNVPFYSAFITVLEKYFPVVDIEFYGRFLSIIFFLLLAISMFFLVLQEEGKAAAFIALLFISFLPTSIFFTHTLLPDTMSIGLIFFSLFLLYKSFFSQEKILWPLIPFSAIFLVLGLLIQTTNIFFIIPFIYLFIKRYEFRFFKTPWFYIFFGIVLIVFLSFEYAMNVNVKVDTIVATSESFLFFQLDYFRTLLLDRVLSQFLGSFGVVLFFIGIFKKPAKSYFFYTLLLSCILHIIVFQKENIAFDYYAIAFIPVLSIFFGIGTYFVLAFRKQFSNIFIIIPTLIIIFFMTGYISYKEAKNYYSYDSYTVTISTILDSLTSENDTIATDTNGDSSLLYLLNRSGLSTVQNRKDIEKYNVNYLVTFNKEKADEFKTTYQTIFESDKVYMFKIQ